MNSFKMETLDFFSNNSSSPCQQWIWASQMSTLKRCFSKASEQDAKNLCGIIMLANPLTTAFLIVGLLGRGIEF